MRAFNPVLIFFILCLCGGVVSVGGLAYLAYARYPDIASEISQWFSRGQDQKPQAVVKPKIRFYSEEAPYYPIAKGDTIYLKLIVLQGDTAHTNMTIVFGRRK